MPWFHDSQEGRRSEDDNRHAMLRTRWFHRSADCIVPVAKGIALVNTQSRLGTTPLYPNLVEEVGLNPIQCGFESLQGYKEIL